MVEIQPEGFLDGQMTVGGGIGQITGPNRFTVPLQPGDNADELNYGELRDSAVKTLAAGIPLPQRIARRREPVANSAVGARTA